MRELTAAITDAEATLVALRQEAHALTLRRAVAIARRRHRARVRRALDRAVVRPVEDGEACGVAWPSSAGWP